MKIRNFGQFMLIMSLMGFAASAMADEVILKNGDRLSGTVVTKADDKLVFKTKYAGEIKIDWAEVSRRSASEACRSPVLFLLLYLPHIFAPNGISETHGYQNS